MQPKIEYNHPKGNWGRDGDQYMAHIAPGETIVPPVISPELRAQLYKEMRAAGIPVEEYVVGEGMSINPATGHPEFGFFKKVFKAINKIPIIGPVVVPAAAAILSGGNPYVIAAATAANTKAQGGSWGQAIGAAAGSYLGGQIGGPGTGTIGSKLKEAGFTGLTDTLGRTLSNTAVSSITGSLIGTSLGTSAGGMIDPPKAASWGNEAANLPSTGVTTPIGGSQGGVAIPGQSSDPNTPSGPTAEEQALMAQRGAGITVGSPSGVSYQSTVIDRETGRPRTINSSFSNNFDRRNSWGSGVSFA